MRNSKLRIIAVLAGAFIALGASAGCDYAQPPQQEDQQEQPEQQDGDQQQEQQDGEDGG